MSAEYSPSGGRELWRRLAVAPARRPEPPTEVDFAAWLEGRLSEPEAARVEAALAVDAELRMAALELAEILGKELPPAPSRLEARARALVGFPAERPEPRRVGLATLVGWLLSPDRHFGLQRGLALAAVLFVALSGIVMGGGLGQRVAEARQAATGTSVAASSTDVASTSLVAEYLGGDGI